MPDILAIKALIFVLAALTIGAIVRPRYDDDRVSVRIIAYWILAALVGFLIELRPLKMALFAVLLLALTPPKTEDRAAFFLCTFFAIPQYATWQIPFPGINYLVRLDYGVLATLVVGVPMMFASRGLGRRELDSVPKNAKINALFLFTFAWIAILSVRDTTATNALRILFMTTMTYLIPYLALTRTLRSEESFKSLMTGLTTVGALITFLALLTIFQNWNHYELTGDSNAFANTSSRGGERRVNLTVNHTLAGVFLTIAFMTFWHAARHAQRLTVVTYPLMFLAFMGVLGTQSRGALLGFMVAIAAMFLVRIKSWPTRIILGGAGLIGLVVLYVVLQASGFAAVDAYGTFNYRAELLDSGIEYVWKHPIAGTVDFASSPHFEHLRQGQGIIDFVNGFLQYALRWGLVGLGLFVILWMWTNFSGVRGVDRVRNSGDGHVRLRSFGIGYVGSHVALLTAFMSTSDGTYFPLMIISLIAVGQGYSRVSRHVSATSESEVTKDDVSTAPDPAAKPAPQVTSPLNQLGDNRVWS